MALAARNSALADYCAGIADGIVAHPICLAAHLRSLEVCALCVKSGLPSLDMRRKSSTMPTVWSTAITMLVVKDSVDEGDVVRA